MHALNYYPFAIVEASKSELSVPVKTVIEESLASLTGGLSPKELNQQFLQKHPDSSDHLIHGKPLSLFHSLEFITFGLTSNKLIIRSTSTV